MSSRGGPVDVLRTLEAAYRLELPDEAWLDGLGRAMAAELDEGCGVHLLRVDFGSPGAPRDCRLYGGTPEWRQRWIENWWGPFIERLPVADLRSLVAFGPVTYATQLWDAVGRGVPTFGAYMSELARRGWSHVLPMFAPAPSASGKLFYPDSFNVTAYDPAGLTLAVIANRAAPASAPPTPDEQERWARVAAHLGAALRLRARLRAGSAEQSGPEAILSPGGRLVHAEGAAKQRLARSALREAAIGVDRARRGKLRSAGQTLELWRALHAGRWSLVDLFERDGRRYLVARPNEPRPSPHAALSRRERQVLSLVGAGHSNKLIAYELGLSPSTVATHLGRLSRKLGVSSPAELVALARARSSEPGAGSRGEEPSPVSGSRAARRARAAT